MAKKQPDFDLLWQDTKAKFDGAKRNLLEAVGARQGVIYEKLRKDWLDVYPATMSKIATVPFGETSFVAADWEPDGTHIANLLEDCYQALDSLQRARKSLSRKFREKDFDMRGLTDRERKLVEFPPVAAR